METKEMIIREYIDAYNQFDTDGMLRHFHPSIVFENSSNGVVNLRTEGIEAFKEQAVQAQQYFTERCQTIQAVVQHEDGIEVQIAYTATLAMDLPNGLKKGETLQLNGKSVFTFLDNTIIGLRDIS